MIKYGPCIAFFPFYLSQTSVWGRQWVLPVSEGVLSQAQDQEADPRGVEHHQEADGETATVSTTSSYHPHRSSSLPIEMYPHANHCFIKIQIATKISKLKHFITEPSLMLAYTPIIFFLWKWLICNNVHCSSYIFVAIFCAPGAHLHSSLKSGQRWYRRGKRCVCCNREKSRTCHNAKISQRKSLCPSS
jgi:hypothetical protein